MIRLRARIKELKFSYEYGWYSLELSIHYLYQIAVFVKQQTITGSFLFAYCIFVSFSALLMPLVFFYYFFQSKQQGRTAADLQILKSRSISHYDKVFRT